MVLELSFVCVFFWDQDMEKKKKKWRENGGGLKNAQNKRHRLVCFIPDFDSELKT